MADPDRTQKILTELHAWGLSLAIDDFGTGYSSLARLKHLPVDILKIDRSFVRDVHRDTGLASMVQAMIQLARGLGMTPLAEGIETRRGARVPAGARVPGGAGVLLRAPGAGRGDPGARHARARPPARGGPADLARTLRSLTSSRRGREPSSVVRTPPSSPLIRRACMLGAITLGITALVRSVGRRGSGRRALGRAHLGARRGTPHRGHAHRAARRLPRPRTPDGHARRPPRATRWSCVTSTTTAGTTCSSGTTAISPSCS